MNFRDALISTYCENPCQVLPNALWKTLAELENLQTSFSVEKNVVTHLQAHGKKKLLVCWTRDREKSPDLNRQQTDLDLALIHQDHLRGFPSARFATRQPYFRLIRIQSESDVKASIPSGFRFREVNIRQETGKVSDLIGQCYEDLHPTIETVMGWARHPTFDPSLWVWVLDNAKGIPVGLGIAEIDNNIQEGSLEWIQVLPQYSGMGIGKSIVRELLARLGTQVKFTTVAGQADNTTNPEALYRSCGFKGSDIWWMFSAWN